MLLNYELTTNLKINTLMDLNKLKQFEDSSNLKVNRSQIAREMNVDRRTISKYIGGFKKKSNRSRKSQFDSFYTIIKELLNQPNKVFAYKRVLWQYLCDNYGMTGAQSSFRRYISSIPEFNVYFKEKKHSIKAPAPMRFETSPGQQAQLDWKESMTFQLKNGEVMTINILVLLLSYSRYRVYHLSLSKTRDVLCHLLDQSFGQMGGVPQVMLTDNMATVMDEARTPYSKGKINNEFQQFANDYGFKVQPCIAGRPETKAKVESPMRILDELKAYSGDLTYEELHQKLKDINERENTRFHEGYQKIPVLGLDKEKDFLRPLPHGFIRNQYSIKTLRVKVNASSMINYKSNQYSVPPEYIDKSLQLQVHDNQIHLYFNMKLVAVHSLSYKKLNYLESHYIEIAKRTLAFGDDKIEEIAKDNLSKIGALYTDDRT